MTGNGRSPYTLGCFGAPGSYSDAAMRRHFNDVDRVMYYDHLKTSSGPLLRENARTGSCR